MITLSGIFHGRLARHPLATSRVPAFAASPNSISIRSDGAFADASMLALMRCVLAFSSLAIVWIDPTDPARLVALTYISLWLYCIYSATLAYLFVRKGASAASQAHHWIDAVFYAWLMGLTEASSSIFFSFFFFSILAASFSYGYREGLRVTAFALLAFSAVGILHALFTTDFELNRLLARGLYLISLGYMVARWGGHELLLKGKLRLLREVNNFWNPRFAVDHTIGVNLDRVVQFYSADSCVLVRELATTPPRYEMCAASARKPARLAEPNAVSEETGRLLLSLPAADSATYCELPGLWGAGHRECVAYDSNLATRDGRAELERLAAFLDTSCFVTVPYAQRDGTCGRIFVTSSHLRFTEADVDFLLQFSATVSPIVENLQLMDQLISKASEHERLKISRDIHDTTIQPYIGLKLALGALHRKAEATNALREDIGSLIDMTDMTIEDLRSYAGKLKTQAALPGDFLVSAVKEQAHRYERFYGIAFEVKTDISKQLTGRLAAEVFHIIAEGMSNVLKHTSAKHAFIEVLCEPDALIVEIGNEANSAEIEPFAPRSIKDRAESLGGHILVDTSLVNWTAVRVVIPI